MTSLNVLSYLSRATHDSTRSCIAISGGPSVGKSTLINCIQFLLNNIEKTEGKIIGRTIRESAKDVIERGLKNNEPAHELFEPISLNTKILAEQKTRYTKAEQKTINQSQKTFTLVDRPELDPVIYCIKEGQDPNSTIIDQARDSLEKQRYNKIVLVVDNIGHFEATKERVETNEKDSKEIRDLIIRSYVSLGLDVRIIEKDSIYNRLLAIQKIVRDELGFEFPEIPTEWTDKSAKDIEAIINPILFPPTFNPFA